MSSHILGKVRLHNFRVVADAVIVLDPEETILFGENNAGKSAILRALDVALGGADPSLADLHIDGAGVRADQAVVDVLIVPAPPATTFNLEVQDLYGPAIRPPAGTPLTEYVVLRTTITPSPTGEAARSRSTFLTAWTDIELEDGGPVPLGGQDGAVRPPHRQSINYSLLDASRDLVKELGSRRSPIGRILAQLGLATADRTALEQRLAELGDDITAASPTLASIKADMARLTGALGSGAAQVDLLSLPPDLGDLGRLLDVQVAAADSAGLPLRLQGSGSRSLTSLLVFRSLIELRVKQEATIDPLVVIGVEEPEAHLHPQAQATAYRQVSELPGQRIIATHSTAPARVAPSTRLRRLERDGAGTRVHSLHALAPEAAQALRRYVLRRRPDVLFARLAVLTEGETEEPAVDAYFRAHWVGDPEADGVLVAGVDGVDNTTNVVRALEALGIRWVALVDNDKQGQTTAKALETALGVDPAQPPQRLFNTGDVDLEAHFAMQHRDLVIDMLVTDTHSEQHAAVKRAELEALAPAELATALGRRKPTWCHPLIEFAIATAIPVPLFDGLIARAQQVLGKPS